MSDFEKDLLYFASPALLGRKQANLFSFSINCLTDYRKEIDRYKKELAPLGISVEYLYCKKQRVYLLVYRKDMMLHYFKQPAVKEFLIKQGYPETPDEEASLYETLHPAQAYHSGRRISARDRVLLRLPRRGRFRIHSRKRA